MLRHLRFVELHRREIRCSDVVFLDEFGKLAPQTLNPLDSFVGQHKAVIRTWISDSFTQYCLDPREWPSRAKASELSNVRDGLVGHCYLIRQNGSRNVRGKKFKSLNHDR